MSIRVKSKNSLTNFSHRCRRFAACRQGIAATEFALTMPVLIVLFFLGLEGTEFSNAGDRVTQAADTLADIVSKEPQIGRTELDDLFIGIEHIIRPIEVEKMDMIVVSVRPDDEGNPKVHWSRSSDPQDRTPYAADEDYVKLIDPGVLQEGFSLIVAEVTYDHDSGLTGQYLNQTISYTIHKKRTPRRSEFVMLCDFNGTDYTNCS